MAKTIPSRRETKQKKHSTQRSGYERKPAQVLFRDRLDGLTQLFRTDRSLVIYDRRLERAVPGFKKLISKFQYRYPVVSGEALKELRVFPSHAEKLLEMTRAVSPRDLTIVAIGGGSVGDFAGFFASVFKRGVALAHVPSTWLAAIDSSHGGKTALNAGDHKNQIGTFHPAHVTVLVRSLLMGQPDERVRDAFGELAKIAMIDGRPWVRELESSKLEGGALLWKFLAPAIQAKLRVVSRDPRETSGMRQILNLGHTIGHVLESELGWSHGFAVAQGLFFAIEFSARERLLPEAQADRALRLLSEKFGFKPELPGRALSARRLEEGLRQDKKRSGKDAVTFVFLRRLGLAERKSVSLAALVAEARRQGWVGR